MKTKVNGTRIEGVGTVSMVEQTANYPQSKAIATARGGRLLNSPQAMAVATSRSKLANALQGKPFRLEDSSLVIIGSEGLRFPNHYGPEVLAFVTVYKTDDVEDSTQKLGLLQKLREWIRE